MKKYIEGKDGWSEWISPMMNRPYRLACCDCGLVHDIRFYVMKPAEKRGKGRWVGDKVYGMKVVFKVRRNNVSTALLRRAKKK